MVKRYAAPALVLFGFLVCPLRSYGQSLTDLMRDQIVNSIAAAPTQGSNNVLAHTATFGSEDAQKQVTDLVNQVSQQIGLQVSNVPLGSSSGGFTYTYDAKLGTFTRSTNTFGPAFAERANTIGRKKASLGMNYQHGRYNSLDGRSLADGDIKFFLPHQTLPTVLCTVATGCLGAVGTQVPNHVQGDMIEADAKLKLSSDTAVFFGNYGVTDKLDIGVAIPINRVSMDLTYHAVIRDFATSPNAGETTTHVFSDGSKTKDFVSSGSASGVGDIVIRAKQNLVSRPTQGLALGLDLRLPTGDSDNMLGTGGTQAEIFFIGSSTVGKVAPHVNAGFTVGSNGVSNQANYVGGAEYAASPKLTVSLDLIGRTFTSADRLQDDAVVHTYQTANGGPIRTVTLDALKLTSGRLTSLLGAAGVKFNAVGNLLISGHVVVTLNSAGLKRGVTPVIGLDYSY